MAPLLPQAALDGAALVSRYKCVAGQQSAGWLGRCSLSLSLTKAARREADTVVTLSLMDDFAASAQQMLAKQAIKTPQAGKRRCACCAGSACEAGPG